MYITTTIKDNMSIHLKVNSINTYLFQLRKRRPFTEEHNKETNRAADEINDIDYIADIHKSEDKDIKNIK